MKTRFAQSTLLLSLLTLLACPNGKPASSIQHRTTPGTQESEAGTPAPQKDSETPDLPVKPSTLPPGIGAGAETGAGTGTAVGGGSSSLAPVPALTFKKGLHSPIMQHQCFYTYPATGAQSFTALIDDYVKGSNELKKREPRPNTLILLQKYKQLFEQNYAKYIAGSHIAAYEIVPVPDAHILALTPNSDDLDDNVAVKTSPYGYRYQNHEAYVDFANRYIGGGVMTQGFVQEEIEIFESSFLPWVAAVRLQQLRNKDPNTPVALPGCDGPNLLALDRTPVVTYWRMFTDVDSKTAYGKKLQTLSPTQVPNVLQLRPSPVDIFSIAMAAPDFGKSTAPYSYKDIENMVLLATRAFYNALLVLDESKLPLVIHTGNWGAGAFKNSIKTVFGIQTIAMAAAYTLFQQTTGKSPKVNFHYDAFDKPSLDLTSEANREFRKAAKTGKKDKNIGEHVNLIYQLTITQKGWQHR